MNEHSSRSHLVYTIYIESKNLLNDILTHSKLHLIDLAGSERISKSGTKGEAQKVIN
jgi:hypothetical protein